jgi:hypothetical protein
LGCVGKEFIVSADISASHAPYSRTSRNVPIPTVPHGIVLYEVIGSAENLARAMGHIHGVRILGSFEVDGQPAHFVCGYWASARSMEIAFAGLPPAESPDGRALNFYCLTVRRNNAREHRH